jgi:FlaA1/EpsC-like NDP-sugar epimerase
MKNVLVVLIKNLVLLVMVIAYLLFAFTNYIGYKESKYVFLFFGILYFISSATETIVFSKLNSNIVKYSYLTDAFLTKRFLKIIVLVCCGFVLVLSGSIVKSLSYLCFTIAITEIIITLWRWIAKLNYIAIDKDAIYISTNKKITLFADELEKIEIRHGITYLVKKNKDSESIRTDTSMKEKKPFFTQLKEWANANNLILIENE